MTTEKRCSRCGEIKPIEEFSKNRVRKDGLNGWCKLCAAVDKRDYRSRNKEKTKAAKLAYYAKNKNKILANRTAYRIANQEKFKEWKKTWREANRDKIRKYKRTFLEDPKNKLNHRIGTSIRGCLGSSKGGRHWEYLVGYTVDDLKNHLEKKFKRGMTWGNYGKWHIDHIVPISAFNFSAPEHPDFKRCWALSNLQPMWAHENIKKSNKLTKHFQPMLAL